MIEENRRVPNRPARYELFDSEDKWVGTYDDILTARKVALDLWGPDHEQDEYRTGKGWHVQVAGCAK